MRRASIKCRMTTGTYILQANRARFNKSDVDPTCPLCKEHSENQRHFLLECSALSESRRKYLDNYKSSIIKYCSEETWRDLLNDKDVFLQFVLDCTKCKELPTVSDNIIHEFEEISRRLCYALHQHRSNVLRVESA